jgi:hypothetical protein
MAASLPNALDSFRSPTGVRHDTGHSDSGDGHGGSHMGPMWIVMGVMMVAMMATAGFYMMRNVGSGTALTPGLARLNDQGPSGAFTLSAGGRSNPPRAR